MTTITNFNRQNVSQMRSEVETALKQVGDKYGINFGVGRITFTGTDFRCKMSAVVKTAVPNSPLIDPKKSLEAVELANRGVYQLGINRTDLTNKFNHPRLGNATLIGYAPRRHKYPFTVKTDNGRTLKITRMMAQELVKNKVVAA